MADSGRQPLGYTDLLAATSPEGATPELIDGELVYKALPRARHSYSQGQVRGALQAYGGGGPPGGWWILIECDVRFTQHRVLRPDLAGWRRERLPTLPDGPVDLRPDWVCEVLSPGHQNHDRITKMTLYADHGVPWVWLVDPEERRLEVYRLAEAWVLHGAYTDGAVFPIAPFEAHELDVSTLFVPGEAPDLAHDVQVAYRSRAAGG